VGVVVQLSLLNYAAASRQPWLAENNTEEPETAQNKALHITPLLNVESLRTEASLLECGQLCECQKGSPLSHLKNPAMYSKYSSKTVVTAPEYTLAAKAF